MHPDRMTLHPVARLAALCACLVLVACSGPEQVVRQESGPGEYRIMPPSPLAGNELSLAWGEDADNPRSMATVASDKSEGYSIIWSVNGNKVGRGHSLPAGLIRKGDRVTVRLETDPVSHERAVAIVGNSPPEIRNVSVSRSEDDPNMAVALFDAYDPDGDRLRHHFEWTVDGVLVADHDRPELPLDTRNRGQSISVRVSTSDGELVNSLESTMARLENHPPTVEIASAPRIVDRDGEPWAELDITALDADGDPVDVRVTGSDIEWNQDSGILSWKLGDGTEPFDVTILAIDDLGASAERRARLKR